MNIDFTGRKAVICGGSRGIGRAVALDLAAAGADVSICARGVETLQRTRAELAAHGHEAQAASVDLADEGAVKAAVIHYTNTQAAMYARSGIRVNGVAQGSIEFPGRGSGTGARRTIQSCTVPCSDRSRSAGWARRRKSRTS